MSRYSVFISYSHADAKTARWLHRAIETYRIPRRLIGSPSPFGPVTRQLLPVFRDRDELPASSDLGSELRAALADSRFQLVLCSPRSAHSHWVNEEILSFKRLHGEHRTLALIVAGEPYAGGEEECFPPALRYRLAPDGSLSGEPAEPIAADLRAGKDGRRLALLKVIAGITCVPLAALVRRDAARRQRRLMWITAASLVIAATTIGLAIYAEGQRRVAERQRQLADRSLDFLIDTFAIANPATENPRTITALTILRRASTRAAGELPNEPGVSARLLRATGEIYLNLGLGRESERDLRLALSRLPPHGVERATTLLKLAQVAQQRSDLRASERAIAEAQASYDPHSPGASLLDAEVADRRGRAAILAGRYAAAADLLGEAARLYAALPGDHRQELGQVWLYRADQLSRLGRLAEAEPLYAAATAAYLAKYGPNHVRTADAIRNQALADFEAGRVEAARTRIEHALGIYRHVLEPDHPLIARALLLKGRILTAAGQPQEALASLDAARALYARIYGPTSSDVGDADFYAAEAESAKGDMAAALARAARTQAIYDRNYGPDDPDQAELLTLRARILAAGGQPAAAGRACTAGVALRERLDLPASTIREARQLCAALQQSSALSAVAGMK